MRLLSRKTPIRHKVSGHRREDSYVNPYLRGEGYRPTRPSVVVGEPERTISMNGLDIIITGKLSRDAKEGLDLFIEIQRFESQLSDPQWIKWNSLGTIVSKCFDHLLKKRFQYEGEYDIHQEYRDATRALDHRDIEEVLMATSAFQTELQLCYADSWRVAS